MPNIYLTINEYNKSNGITPWRYIGSDQNDNEFYYGSSKQLKEDMIRLGKNAFKKIILEQFGDIENKDLRRKEAEYLKRHDVKTDPSYYNLTDQYAPAGGKKGMKHSEKFPRSKAWIESRTGHTWTDEQKARRSGNGNPMFGKKQTEATKEKWKAQRIGKNNPNALVWEIEYPDGKIIKVKGLRAFCRDHNLSYDKTYSNRLPGIKITKQGQGKGGRGKKNDTI
jgi:hypothetical protein